MDTSLLATPTKGLATDESSNLPVTIEPSTPASTDKEDSPGILCRVVRDTFDLAGEVIGGTANLIVLSARAGRQVMDELGGILVDASRNVGQAVKEITTPTAEALKDSLSHTGRGLGEGVGNILSNVGDGVGEGVEGLLSNVGDGLGQGIEGVLEHSLSGAGSGGRALVTETAKGIAEAAPELAYGAGMIPGALGHGVVTGVRGLRKAA
jgi:hypothetical protein